MSYPQHRYATNGKGKGLWVPITDEDRKDVIQSLPVKSRKWVDAIMLQEGGGYDGDAGLRRLWANLGFRCEYEDFKEGLSICRVWIETELENMALDNAGGAHLSQPRIDQDILDLMKHAEMDLANGVV